MKNEEGQFIYMTVPTKYECVYKKLLIKMSDFGVDLIKDCTSTCKGVNRDLINCWNMFQSACAAYALGETKQSDLLIYYIMKKLQIDCDFNNSFEPLYVYVGQTDIEPRTFMTMTVEDILSLNPDKINVRKEENRKVSINQNLSIHYVVVPDTVELENAEFGEILTTSLWKSSKAEGAYRRTTRTGVIDDVNYSVYFFYSPVGRFKEDIKLNFNLK